MEKRKLTGKKKIRLKSGLIEFKIKKQVNFIIDQLVVMLFE